MAATNRNLSFRYRLTLWYILIFSLSLVIYQVFSYYELKANLTSQIDQSLSSATTQAIQNLDIENGNLAFQNVEKTPVKPLSSIQTVVLIRILDQNGIILHKSLNFPDIPTPPNAVPSAYPASQGTTLASSSSFSSADVSAPPSIRTYKVGSSSFRVITTVFLIPSLHKWNTVQIAESMVKIDEELGSSIVRFLIGLPFILLIAALGGLFLANTALKPIAAMRDLAGKVHEDNLSKRLDYEGPADEFGSLAAEFDSMLDRLEASFKREKRFSADASHELKTPLTALKGKLDVALSRTRPAKDYYETLLSMRSDVERLISLSQDLLLISRIGTIRLSSRAEKINLPELLDSCVDQIATVAADKKLTIRRNYSNPLEIWGIRDYLVRLFLNILDNAVKFSDESPEISISARRQPLSKTGPDPEQANSEYEVLVEVEDNGPGIPEETIPFLFEPFYRVETDRSRLKGGSGLGLAIAKEIVDLHGGSIEVRNSTKKGALVAIRLPTGLGAPPQILT